MRLSGLRRQNSAGILRIRTSRGWVSTKASDGTRLLRVLGGGGGGVGGSGASDLGSDYETLYEIDTDGTESSMYASDDDGDEGGGLASIYRVSRTTCRHGFQNRAFVPSCLLCLHTHSRGSHPLGLAAGSGSSDPPSGFRAKLQQAGPGAGDLSNYLDTAERVAGRIKPVCCGGCSCTPAS